MIRFWPTIKGMRHRKISLFCQKLWKKYQRDRFLRRSMVPGGWNQISLKSYNSGFTCRSQKRFSLFYSSSKALSNNISLTFNPFWWRQPLWRHYLTFWVKQKLNIIWSTIVVYLASLVEKWKEMWKIRKFSLNKPLGGWFGPAVNCCFWYISCIKLATVL